MAAKIYGQKFGVEIMKQIPFPQRCEVLQVTPGSVSSHLSNKDIFSQFFSFFSIFMNFDFCFDDSN